MSRSPKALPEIMTVVEFVPVILNRSDQVIYRYCADGDCTYEYDQQDRLKISRQPGHETITRFGLSDDRAVVLTTEWKYTPIVK